MRSFKSSCILTLIIAAFALAASPSSPTIEVPILPTEKNEFGGRPGTFHFTTNEQTMADARALKLAFAALDSLDNRLSSLEPSRRAEFEKDLATLRSFAEQVHSGSKGTAGETAAKVEQRLNDSKGNRMCGACHGHGMMHSGGIRDGSREAAKE
jgi:hypothetical protein